MQQASALSPAQAVTKYPLEKCPVSCKWHTASRFIITVLAWTTCSIANRCSFCTNNRDFTSGNCRIWKMVLPCDKWVTISFM